MTRRGHPEQSKQQEDKRQGGGRCEMCRQRRMGDLVRPASQQDRRGRNPLVPTALAPTFVFLPPSCFRQRVNCTKYMLTKYSSISKTLTWGCFLASTEINWCREILSMRVFGSIAGLSSLALLTLKAGSFFAVGPC